MQLETAFKSRFYHLDACRKYRLYDAQAKYPCCLLATFEARAIWSDIQIDRIPPELDGRDERDEFKSPYLGLEHKSNQRLRGRGKLDSSHMMRYKALESQ
jgi:hypothetical protein